MHVSIFRNDLSGEEADRTSPRIQAAVEEIPSSICNLSHLRYLNMSGNKMIRKLPSSIYKLMMNLQKLSIANCSKLSALPEFTAYELRELKIQGCPELSKRCTRDSGADWPKIARVPKVEIDGVKLMMNNEGRN